MADEVSFLCYLGKRYHLHSADFHFSSDVASLAIAIVVFREENTLDKGGIVVGASFLILACSVIPNSSSMLFKCPQTSSAIF